MDYAGLGLPFPQAPTFFFFVPGTPTPGSELNEAEWEQTFLVSEIMDVSTATKQTAYVLRLRLCLCLCRV